jgi:transposase, IS6 family
VDETSVEVKGRWAYLCRALDKRGDTIDFLLSGTRSAKAAKGVLGKALKGRKDWEIPDAINTHKAGCYGPAIDELKKEDKLPETPSTVRSST